ncbi:hypothetical protein [Helicobacter sp. WB40]|uniref:hypothetical protein n=1 Tax=Helicobacter sp. WB40 TaxID=3004130 RepID=UPI0022EBD314|nr:hypothetical protein [Helicobacter sp. WB40]MDA3967016.1 hypothetical protein [Helicobacter sp. WB40]
MQIRVLVAIFTIFTFIMLFVLIRNYSDAMNLYTIPDVMPYNLVDDNSTDSVVSSGASWIEKLSMQSDVAYIYPASEMQVRLLSDANIQKEGSSIFRVSVGVIDDYQFFCINQVFMSHKIQYSYYKVGDNIWLVVSTKDEKYLKQVLDELARYEISYTMTKS